MHNSAYKQNKIVKIIRIANIPLLKSYENSKIANNSLKGCPSWPSEVNWWSHDAIVWKSEKHGDFCVHAFINCVDNLYASKILSLKITTTQHLSILTNIRKIIINETFTVQPIPTTVNRKAPYQKYLTLQTYKLAQSTDKAKGSSQGPRQMTKEGSK